MKFRMPFARQVLSLSCLSLLAAGAIASPLFGQADEEDLREGLVASYRHEDGDGQGLVAHRVDRRLAFDWGRGAPDPRLPAGSFHAQWRGYLMSQATGQYRLHAYLQGDVTVKLAGQTVLRQRTGAPAWRASEPLELPFDWHPLEIDFKSDGNGDARLSLFWSGPGFGLEPISPARLFHEPAETPAEGFERGADLAAALRCAACHELPGGSAVAAPALDRLAGSLSREWLVEWLGASHADDTETLDVTERRMPHFRLQAGDAEALAAYLLAEEPVADQAASPSPPKSKLKEPSAERGRQLLLTSGCLACHELDSLGTAGMWSGGDLARIGEKRTPSFFLAWLSDPRSVNRSHRMPPVDLSEQERVDLAAYLAVRGVPSEPGNSAERADGSDGTAGQDDSRQLVARGRELFTEYRCHSCHVGPRDDSRRSVERGVLRADGFASQSSCLQGGGGARQPHYPLSEEDRQALRTYLTTARSPAPRQFEAQQLMARENCLACHGRSKTEGLAPAVAEMGREFPELASQLPAMTPPSLESVGDKLHDEALHDAIARRDPTHRPWLLVRMPKYDLSEAQRKLLVDYFVAADRIPPREGDQPPEVSAAEIRVAGGRLVTTSGFGCTSCHQVGSVTPPDAPLNAKGPDLSALGKRIRYPWFDRWVRNPARIVPRMEMPSVKLPVRGVLAEDLDRQLATVWHALNEPGFEPPEPNPVRIVRQSGQEVRGRAEVITDVVHTRAGPVYIKPLLIGLPNRHNLLLDLSEARLAEWTVGDTALQRTKGKTWFWELAGAEVARFPFADPPWQMIVGDRRLVPRRQGQFLTEFDRYLHLPGGIHLRHRLHFADSTEKPLNSATVALHVEQTLTVPGTSAVSVAGESNSDQGRGFDRQFVFRSPLRDVRLRLRLVPEAWLERVKWDEQRRSARLAGVEGLEIRIVDPADATIDAEGFVELPIAGDAETALALEYRSALPADRFPVSEPAPQPLQPQKLDVVPGWEAVRLPLTEQIMPTALAWRNDGSLVFTSLKGRVWLVRDTDDDGLEDRLRVFSDELAAPFGVATGKDARGNDYVDVINKYGLLRLYDDDGDGRAERVRTLASGWGHTTDYHDWAVGLPSDGAGGYFVGTACQQDKRTSEAARWRGRVLQLVPRAPDADDPRAFQVRVVSRGHRFPIGIARNRAGALFVTDNQGNYNPFNELNHVLPGSHYGFLNALERRPDYQPPPLKPPAVNIPHPWTRSVNGICFLETPDALRRQTGRDAFGPWEGHLIGCEYDTRRLIRMSVEEVEGTMQGAAYPFSYDEPPSGEPLRGPLACAVSPSGDLYVGCIRDSGWGGANNVGSIVRLRLQPDEVPAGLAEVRATPRGFLLRFTRPVDAKLAANPANYSVSSYTRVATPAYGGPDKDRRQESIKEVSLSEDGREVRLELSTLREGYVYDIRLKRLVPDGEPFFPAEAFYTLNRAPAAR